MPLAELLTTGTIGFLKKKLYQKRTLAVRNDTMCAGCGFVNG